MAMNLQLHCTPHGSPGHECTSKGVWPVVATGTEHWASVCLYEVSCLLLDSWVTVGSFFLCKKGKLKPFVKCFEM